MNDESYFKCRSCGRVENYAISDDDENIIICKCGAETER